MTYRKNTLVRKEDAKKETKETLENIAAAAGTILGATMLAALVGAAAIADENAARKDCSFKNIELKTKYDVSTSTCNFNFRVASMIPYSENDIRNGYHKDKDVFIFENSYYLVAIGRDIITLRDKFSRIDYTTQKQNCEYYTAEKINRIFNKYATNSSYGWWS